MTFSSAHFYCFIKLCSRWRWNDLLFQKKNDCLQTCVVQKKSFVEIPNCSKKPHCVKFNVPGNSEFRSTTNPSKRETASFMRRDNANPKINVGSETFLQTTIVRNLTFLHDFVCSERVHEVSWFGLKYLFCRQGNSWKCLKVAFTNIETQTWTVVSCLAAVSRYLHISWMISSLETKPQWTQSSE